MIYFRRGKTGLTGYAVQIAQKIKVLTRMYYNLTRVYYNLTCVYNRIVIPSVYEQLLLSVTNGVPRLFDS